MAYKSSPRPDFNVPTPIPYSGVTRYLWGDDESGQVNDWIYASSGKIHQLVFGFPAGKGFSHSPSFRTVFGADEVLIVIQGRMIIANPETGEVQVAGKGDAVFFRKDTWHNAWAMHGEEVRVLEYFAPPPSTGSSGKYAQSRPYVDTPKYQRAELFGNWPMGKQESGLKGSLRMIGPRDRLWSLASPDPGALTGLIASTEHLTAGETILAPGGRGALQRHGGDMALYVAEGIINVQAPHEASATGWYELHPGDGFFVPEGFSYQLFNMGSVESRLYFGVAPSFLPAAAR